MDRIWQVHDGDGHEVEDGGWMWCVDLAVIASNVVRLVLLLKVGLAARSSHRRSLAPVVLPTIYPPPSDTDAFVNLKFHARSFACACFRQC